MDGTAGRVAILIPLVGGVDLGTTFSVAAVNEHGSVRVIKDKWGNPLVPSIVSLAPDGGVWVGKEARERLALHPSRTVYDAKRFIGR
ncbi:hsp70-like protein, partial [Nannochloropsis gaditana CCMP526]|uniref:hsp70-like protein n=1 Tax=Nannochloropsis gaditana (strain CCMP526) TaxID=1093141 RepID=UPI00029F5CF4